MINKTSGIQQIVHSKLTAQEREWAHAHLKRHMNQKMVGTPYKYGQKVNFREEQWRVYDADATAGEPLLVLYGISAPGEMLQFVPMDLSEPTIEGNTMNRVADLKGKVTLSSNGTDYRVVSKLDNMRLASKVADRFLTAFESVDRELNSIRSKTAAPFLRVVSVPIAPDTETSDIEKAVHDKLGKGNVAVRLGRWAAVWVETEKEGDFVEIRKGKEADRSVSNDRCDVDEWRYVTKKDTAEQAAVELVERYLADN